MNKEIIESWRRESLLHFEVMGIALSVHDHGGSTRLFKFMEEALDNCDALRMGAVRQLFELLPKLVRARFLKGESPPEEAAKVLEVMESSLLEVLECEPLPARCRAS